MLEKLTLIKSKYSKVSFKDINLWKLFGAQVAVISSLVSIISFCMPLPSKQPWKIGSLLAFIIALILIFICDWYKANRINHVNLKINGTNIAVGVGDLFAQKGLKIIGVNNYIDLIADDNIVSKKTLHGQFVTRHQDKIGEIKKAILSSVTLSPKTNLIRPGQQSYDYGSCVLYKEYVLTVLTEFNLKNNAYTTIQEYIQFWMTFWGNIDVIYNSRTINIPIMGAGQTRFRGSKPEKQELIEIALWTLKKSGFCNNYADKKINFVIYKDDAPEINFYRIKNIFG